jgi:ribonuclease HII
LVKTADAIDRLEFERLCLQQGLTRIAGVDEAGRGPLAGPVLASAVMFPLEWLRQGLPAELAGLNDSKKLSASQREKFFRLLTTDPAVRSSVSESSVEAIEALNILQATHQAMRHALQKLQPPPEQVLVDGLLVPRLGFPHTPIVKGDARSYTIAAASVLAKVTRDRLMEEYDRQYPQYGFAEHKGYGTPRHLAALVRWGPCPLHRRHFGPIKAMVQPELFG